MQNPSVPKRALVLFQHIVDPSSPDEADVLVQAECVGKSLRELGYGVETFAVTFDLMALSARIKALDPALVFNLVETVDGACRYSFLAPLMLEKHGIPFAGCSSEAMYLTTNKILTKKLLEQAGIATPPWVCATEGDFLPGERYIVKAVSEEASVGIDQSSVRSFDRIEDLRAMIAQKEAAYHSEFFAERFIDGREFNISVLASAAGVGGQVLPPAEIKFALDNSRYVNIVDYQAKWDETSAQYQGTERVFVWPGGEVGLIEEIKAISRKCWEVFHLNGYARVDFRVDADGRPFVLEINANPCIAPDAGFIAAAARAGLSYTEVVSRIIADPCRPRALS